jgi:hypothetical protein
VRLSRAPTHRGEVTKVFVREPFERCHASTLLPTPPAFR